MPRRRVLGSVAAFAGAMLLGLFAFGGSSRAETGPWVDVDVRGRSGRVAEVSLDASGLADDVVRARVASGLPVRLALAVSLPLRSGGALRTVRACRVVGDAWERGYVVSTREGSGRVEGVDAALARCLVLDRTSAVVVEVSPRASTVTLELNPASDRTERALSGWLSRADGGEGEPTFFGAWLASTVFEDEPAERTIRARARAGAAGVSDDRARR